MHGQSRELLNYWTYPRYVGVYRGHRAVTVNQNFGEFQTTLEAERLSASKVVWNSPKFWFTVRETCQVLSLFDFRIPFTKLAKRFELVFETGATFGCRHTRMIHCVKRGSRFPKISRCDALAPRMWSRSVYKLVSTVLSMHRMEQTVVFLSHEEDPSSPIPLALPVLNQTRDQQRFSKSKLAAEWHELMVRALRGHQLPALKTVEPVVQLRIYHRHSLGLHHVAHKLLFISRLAEDRRLSFPEINSG